MNTKVLILAGLIGAVAVTGVVAKEGPRAALPTFEELDANGDGSITKAEMEARRDTAMATRFGNADANNDGALTVEEIVAAASAKAADRAQARAEKMMERLDADDSGSLSQDELQAARDGGGKRRGGLDRMFDRVDANDDGAISKEEFDAAKGRFMKRRGQDRG